MMRRRLVFVLVTALFSLSGVALVGPRGEVAADSLPKRLSDRAFWRMIVDFSEPGGVFGSDNLLSNETTYQEIIPELRKSLSASGAYLGVGPDQNFTTHNVTIKGNIIAGMMSACAQLNYPENVSLTGNICDLASDSGYQSIVIYGRGKVDLIAMPNNKFEHNVVISASSGVGYGYYGATKTLTPMEITDNDYHNYVGSSIKSTGNSYVGSDSDPVSENPGLSGWTYTSAKDAQVSDSPVSFTAVKGGWGPPGFTIPHTGTAPSCPH